jgi:DNA replication licensing factor MCM4
VLDKPDEVSDSRLAKHLVSLFYKELPEKMSGLYDVPTFTRYVSYARKACHPRLNDASRKMLVCLTAHPVLSHRTALHAIRRRRAILRQRETASAQVDRYVELRQTGIRNKTVTATPRQLESLIRLSEAHARMRVPPLLLLPAR